MCGKSLIRSKQIVLHGQREEQPPHSFDMVWAAEFMDELADFDRLMNKAVVEAGILRHVPRCALSRAGRSRLCTAFAPPFPAIHEDLCTQHAQPNDYQPSLVSTCGASPISDKTVGVCRTQGPIAERDVIISFEGEAGWGPCSCGFGQLVG